LKRGDRERLDDIAEAIEAIQTHAENLNADERLKRDAILYNLMTIGEAVKGLTDETRAKRPEIPWRQISGLRDLLAHEYYRIDMREIAGMLKRDLEPLSVAVNALRVTKPPRARR
jgi:uncharacterized protein with HEPN domain